MPDRTATTTWTGDLQQGSGSVELTSSGVGTYDVSFPKRGADDADGTTSPEEMLAAAHSSCFAMALSNEIAEAGGTPTEMTVTATVTLDTSALKISEVALTIRATVDGLDESGFDSAVSAAEEGCPVSNLFRGNTEITVDASLS